MWSDELEEGRLHSLVQSRFKRILRASRKPRPISKIRPRRRRRFGSSWGLKKALSYRPVKVKGSPTAGGTAPKGPPKSPQGMG